MAKTRFFHVFLATTDMKRSIEFYTKAFEGAHILYQFDVYIDHNLCMFSLGNGIVIEYIEMPEVDKQDGKWQHIAIECDDIQEQYQRLLDAGATVKPGMELRRETLHGINGFKDTDCWGVHLYGPDGEEIELCQNNGKWGWEE